MRTLLYCVKWQEKWIKQRLLKLEAIPYLERYYAEKYLANLFTKMTR